MNELTLGKINFSYSHNKFLNVDFTDLLDTFKELEDRYLKKSAIRKNLEYQKSQSISDFQEIGGSINKGDYVIQSIKNIILKNIDKLPDRFIEDVVNIC